MAKVAIPTRTVKCKDGSTDVYVELNSNSNADDNVQAFVDCFKGVAETARDICVFCQVLFPEKSVGIPFFQQGIFPAFSGHYASLRMRACSIR